MKYTLFCFKDKQINKFTAPSLSVLHDPEELKEDVRVQIIKSGNRRVFSNKNLVILGEYDNETGNIQSCDPEFVLNCDEVLAEISDYEREKNSKDLD